MLRSKSSGVAKNSLHMQGKAIDFYIPGVELSKLRAIGLRMQAGGVGFYPTSGSPFVHMDTGSVRHWPRMSRKQLIAVFPQGNTIHVPSDGKPLPGYQQALAEYKARKASGAIAVASTAAPPTTSEPMVLAAADEDEANAAAPPRRAVAVASYATTPPPMPRLAPRRSTLPDPIAVASVAKPAVAAPAPVLTPAVPTARPVIAAAAEPTIGVLAPDFDFGPPQDWVAPSVPAALAAAMAERDQGRRGSSLPIAPTAVVATIDMSRPLSAAAITTAVLRTANDPAAAAPAVMAYAAPEEPAIQRPAPRVVTGSGIRLPVLSPRRAAEPTVAAARVIDPTPAAATPLLTMTALDTQGLRLWIGSTSTRQKLYALLTMPDFARSPELMAKPAMLSNVGFGTVAYEGLRTDRFSIAPVRQAAQWTATPILTAVR